MLRRHLNNLIIVEKGNTISVCNLMLRDTQQCYNIRNIVIIGVFFYFILYLERNKNVFVIQINCSIKSVIDKTRKLIQQNLRVLYS